MNRNGKIGRIGHINKRRDRWQGFLRGLRRWKIDHFADHSIHNYINAIADAVEEEKQQLDQGGTAKLAGELAGDDADQKQANHNGADPSDQPADMSDTNELSNRG